MNLAGRKVSVVFWMSLVSCGKVAGDLPLDGAPGDGPTGVDAAPAVTTIQALRMASPPPADGTPVALRGVVVIAHETSGGNGALILQDASGGDFSGITLFCNFSDSAACNLTKGQIDNMPIGRVVDVNGVFGLQQPMGTPLPPLAPRIAKAMVTQTQMVATLDPRLVSAAHLEPNQGNMPATQAILWTYVRVDGPITVTMDHPAQFTIQCPNALDAGTPNVSHRAVMARVTNTTDLAVGLRRGDETANYCLFQCERTCANEIKVNDSFEFLQGVPDTFSRAGSPQSILVTPVRNTDIGPKI